jgi:hypothetical protein
MHEGRLGAMVEVPSATLIDQLDLPKEKGVVVQEVLPDSAAAKAGLKPHDILLELNGKDVPSKIDEFVKQLNDIKAKTPVNAVVLRKGRKETIKGIELPEEPKDAFRFRRGARFNPLRNEFLNPEGAGVQLNVSRVDGKVTASLKEKGLSLKLTGTVDAGKLKVQEIAVQEDGGAPQKYDSVEKVPEKHREQTRKLIEAAEKGSRPH